MGTSASNWVQCRRSGFSPLLDKFQWILYLFRSFEEEHFTEPSHLQKWCPSRWSFAKKLLYQAIICTSGQPILLIILMGKCLDRPLCKRVVRVDLQSSRKYKKVWRSQAGVVPLTTESSAFSLIHCSQRQSNRKRKAVWENKLFQCFYHRQSPSTPSPSVLRCYARMSGGGKESRWKVFRLVTSGTIHPACLSPRSSNHRLIYSPLLPSSFLLSFVRRLKLHLLAVGSWVSSISPPLQLFTSHLLIYSPLLLLRELLYGG